MAREGASGLLRLQKADQLFMQLHSPIAISHEAKVLKSLDLLLLKRNPPLDALRSGVLFSLSVHPFLSHNVYFYAHRELDTNGLFSTGLDGSTLPSVVNDNGLAVQPTVTVWLVLGTNRVGATPTKRPGVELAELLLVHDPHTGHHGQKAARNGEDYRAITRFTRATKPGFRLIVEEPKQEIPPGSKRRKFEGIVRRQDDKAIRPLGVNLKEFHNQNDTKK
jgi:hypothetical protein